jgi:hypothetical protein
MPFRNADRGASSPPAYPQVDPQSPVNPQLPVNPRARVNPQLPVDPQRRFGPQPPQPPQPQGNGRPEANPQLAGLSTRAADAEAHAARLAVQVEQLTAALEDARREATKPPIQTPSGPPTFIDLGDHVGQILTIAEREAEQIRSAAAAEAERAQVDFETSVTAARRDADAYTLSTRTSADHEAARILEEAHRAADALLDDAHRQSSALHKEAELMVDQQKAMAGKAAADFEQTLAERRDSAEASFQERTAIAHHQFTEAQELVARLRTEGEQAHLEAIRRAARLADESEQKAEQIVADAVARAGRIRAESDREMAAAMQRRDSINAQLVNVRQMLATTSWAGSGASSVEDPTGPPPNQGVEPLAHPTVFGPAVVDNYELAPTDAFATRPWSGEPALPRPDNSVVAG